jgi:phage terminase large subunit-like protein
MTRVDVPKRTMAEMVAEHPKLRRIDNPDTLMRALSEELNLSLAQIVAELVDEEREAILSGMDEEKLLYDWTFWGRPSQIPPEDDTWSIYAMVAGRGAGKTRAGAEWVNKVARENPGCRIALVARTAADTRDVMVNGESGICAVGHPEGRPTYRPAYRSVVWPNGSQATLFSAEEPDQLRGPQFHFAWADEAAAWKHNIDDSGLSTWDNLEIATRLGTAPQMFVTTTPKRTKFMYDLLDRAEEDPKEVIIVRGSTAENAGNLAKKYIKRIYATYKGTRLAEQELHGLMLTDIEGALWTEDLIGAARVFVPPGEKGPVPPLKVIAVDPTVAEEPKDECGIVVVGATKHRKLTQRHAYVLEDASMMGSPTEWAHQVVKTWEKHKCPVVVEKNQGHALLKGVIHQINPEIKVLEVVAYQGKKLRAESVTLAYDQGRVHHVDYLPELESQMTSWVPGETKKSPDRVDALVYAIRALLIKPPRELGAGRVRAQSVADRRLPDERIQGRVRDRKIGT